MVDDLTALRLQLDWGVDEALGSEPVNRFARAPTPALSAPASPIVAAPLIARAHPAATADTLDALHAALDGFTACPLRATATHTIRPSGSAAATVVFIGDAPGNDDDRSGHAFAGAPGAMLDRVMASIGLSRETMLLTTLVPWRPPGNRPASESEVAACLPFLHRLLALVRPRAVLLAGAGPVAALTGQSGTIRQLRGRWLELPLLTEQINLPALPVLPLAQWLRDGSTKQQLWNDLLLLQEAVTTA